MEWSGQEVAQNLMELPVTYYSHKHKYLDWSSLMTSLVQRNVIIPEDFGLEMDDRYVGLSQQGYVLDFLDDVTTVETQLSPYELQMFYERSPKMKSSKFKKLDLFFRNKKKRSYMKFTNKVCIPVLSGNRALPDENSPIYNLFIVVVFTDTVLRSHRGDIKTLNIAEVQNIATMVRKEKHFVNCTMDNIKSWKESKQKAKEDTSRDDPDSEDSDSDDDSNDVANPHNTQREYYENRVRNCGALLSQMQMRLADESASKQFSTFDLSTARQNLFRQLGSAKVAKLSEGMSSLETLITSFSNVCTYNSLSTNSIVGEAGNVTESVLRINYSMLKKMYKDEDKRLKNVIIDEKDVHSHKDWYSENPKAKCLDRLEWSDVARKVYYSQQRSRSIPSMSAKDQLRDMFENDQWYIIQGNVTEKEIIRALTLTSEQAFPFLVFAKYIDKLLDFLSDPSKHVFPEPLRLAIDGVAGSGKSHVYKSMLMYVYQKGLIHSVRACAQTAKAAVNMTTSVLMAETVHSLFGLSVFESRNGQTYTSTRSNSRSIIESNFLAVLILFVDEIGLTPLDILGQMSMGLNSISKGCSWIFGSRCVITFGDQCQMKLGNPLYQKVLLTTRDEKWRKEKRVVMSKLIKMTKGYSKKFYGRQCWLSFKCCQLYEVNRFLDTAGGVQLARIVQALRCGVIRDEMFDWLNDRYIFSDKNDIDMKHTLWKEPIFIHPRNFTITKIAAYLQVVAGLSKKKIVFVWKSRDLYKGTVTDLSAEDSILANNEKFTKAGFQTFVYYHGIEYSFIENRYKSIGWLNKNSCSGYRIELHPNDKRRFSDFKENYNSGVFHLTHQPMYIVVVPDGNRSTKDFGEGVKKIVVAKEKIRFTMKNSQGEDIEIDRVGFVNLIFANCKTDFGCQCVTIKWPRRIITDFQFPADGRLNPESLLVIISRAQSLDQIGLFRPLFTNIEEKQKFKKKLENLITIKGDKREELLRLEKNTDELKKEFSYLLEIANANGCSRGETITFKKFSEYT